MHPGLYNAEKEFTGEELCTEWKGELSYISHSKGAAVMYPPSERIGEDQVNKALRNLLYKNRYHAPKPVAMDFMDELLRVAGKKTSINQKGCLRKWKQGM